MTEIIDELGRTADALYGDRQAPTVRGVRTPGQADNEPAAGTDSDTPAGSVRTLWTDAVSGAGRPALGVLAHHGHPYVDHPSGPLPVVSGHPDTAGQTGWPQVSGSVRTPQQTPTVRPSGHPNDRHPGHQQEPTVTTARATATVPGHPDAPSAGHRQHRPPTRDHIDGHRSMEGSVGHPPTPSKVSKRTGPQPLPTAIKIGINGAVWVVSIIATVFAATGQVGFAQWAYITDIRMFMVPAFLEFGMVAFLGFGYMWARTTGGSPLPLWGISAVIGGFAIYTNVVHAGQRAGLVFGGASALAMIMWFAKLGIGIRIYRATQGEGGLGRLWILRPRLAFRAMMIKYVQGVDKTAEAREYARLWIAVFDDARDARDERGHRIRGRVRRRTAWRQIEVATNSAVADLPSSVEIARIRVTDRPPLAAESQARDAAPVAAIEARAAEPQPAPEVRAPRPPTRREPLPEAPVSPASSTLNPFVLYQPEIAHIQAAVPGWRTREKRFVRQEVIDLLKAARESGALPNARTSGPVSSKIAWLIEAMSTRHHQIPDHIWAGDLAGVDRELPITA